MAKNVKILKPVNVHRITISSALEVNERFIAVDDRIQ
ncbi:hypothetical protein SAMN00768000_3268 [Sulfobacillus thermosulfidooxidans DSM 9293]|uniref:Uncharacterized protein n=1 Tax=Sulfobacillus thermosulfidooxidans (strain DSM 9293 / VKM B-1269 / AT-1) TaxID=929705 RepID=A0A1W1WLM3_SULTA|nr:hypothetical protein SAMN00768000_3268 [Sulfobacillus thermosulfidooxidans DSM 9293]